MAKDTNKGSRPHKVDCEMSSRRQSARAAAPSRNPPTREMISSFTQHVTAKYNFLTLHRLESFKRKDVLAAQVKRSKGTNASSSSPNRPSSAVTHTPRNIRLVEKKDFPATIPRDPYDMISPQADNELGSTHWDTKKFMSRLTAPEQQDPEDIVYKVGAINEAHQTERLNQHKLQAELEQKLQAWEAAGSRYDSMATVRRERKLVEMAVHGNAVGVIVQKASAPRPVSARQFARASAVRYRTPADYASSSPSSSSATTVSTPFSFSSSSSATVSARLCSRENITGAWTKKLVAEEEEDGEEEEEKDENDFEVLHVTARSVEEMLAAQDAKEAAEAEAEAERKQKEAQAILDAERVEYSNAPTFEEAKDNAVWLWPSSRTHQPVVEKKTVRRRRKIVRKPPPAPKQPIPGQDLSAPPKKRVIRRKKANAPPRKPTRPGSSPLVREQPDVTQVLDKRFALARRAMEVATYGRVNANQWMSDLKKTMSAFGATSKQKIMPAPPSSQKTSNNGPSERPQSAVPRGKPRTRADTHKPHPRPQTARIRNTRPSSSSSSSVQPQARVASVRPQTARSRAARVNDRVMIEDIRTTLKHYDVSVPGHALDRALIAPQVSLSETDKGTVLPGAMSERLVKNPYWVAPKKGKRKKRGARRGRAWRFKKKTDANANNRGAFSKSELKRMNQTVLSIPEQKVDAMFHADWVQVAEGLSVDFDFDSAAQIKAVLLLYYPKLQFIFNVYSGISVEEAETSSATMPFPVFMQMCHICEVVDKFVTPSKLEELFVRVVDADETYIRSTEPCHDHSGKAIFERCPPYYDAEFGLTRAQFMELLVRASALKMNNRAMYVADTGDKSIEALMRDFILPRAVVTTTVRSALRRRFVDAEVSETYAAVYRSLWEIFYSYCQADDNKRFLLQSEAEALLHAEFQVDVTVARTEINAAAITDVDSKTGQIRLTYASFLEIITRLGDREIDQVDTSHRSVDISLAQKIVNFLAIHDRFQHFRSQTLIAGANLL